MTPEPETFYKFHFVGQCPNCQKNIGSVMHVSDNVIPCDIDVVHGCGPSMPVVELKYIATTLKG